MSRRFVYVTQWRLDGGQGLARCLASRPTDRSAFSRAP